MDCVSCDPRWSPAKCIREISLDEANVETCFGSKNVRTASVALVAIYLLITSLVAGYGRYPDDLEEIVGTDLAFS